MGVGFANSTLLICDLTFGDAEGVTGQVTVGVKLTCLEPVQKGVVVPIPGVVPGHPHSYGPFDTNPIG
jgi:hypothetical protein